MFIAVLCCSDDMRYALRVELAKRIKKHLTFSTHYDSMLTDNFVYGGMI